MNSNPSNLDPKSPSHQAEALTQAAEVYLAQGKLAEAIASSRQAIDRKPDWAPAYVAQGNALHAQGQVDAAIRCYSQALELNPNFAQAYANLGSMLYQQSRIEEAIFNYQKALQIQPDLAAVYWNLGVALKQQGKLADATASQFKALELSPNLVGVPLQIDLGQELAKQGQLESALTCWRQAIQQQPDAAEAYCQIGIVQRHQGEFKAAILMLQKAIELKPDFISAHQNLCGILRDSSNLEAARSAVHRYYQSCHETDPVMTALYLISTYHVSGFSQKAKEQFLELEAKLLQNIQIVKTALELKALYANLLFSMPYLRDDPAANSRLAKLIAQKYLDHVIKPRVSPVASSNLPPAPRHPLKIGFLSSHFHRHSVGWCSFDIIRELSQLTPYVYLYITDRLPEDDMTQQFEQVVTQLYRPKNYPNGQVSAAEIVEQIQKDQINVLIDLDSISVPLHSEILYQKPANLCLSWLGFDAPYISSENYFLVDRHTHPPEQENYYPEKLLRMPDSFMAVSGFKQLAISPTDLRKAHRISLDQIVYLCVAPGRKFNEELAYAQVAILKEVPNSILIHKALGDAEIFKTVYHQACDKLEVGKHRLKFIDRLSTEEEHRALYNLADIMLDSYPYNGGTHTLESLWFDVPVVTRVGEQFLSRMGYSCLKALAIEAGIAHSWEEYIQWGIKLGKDTELRNSIVKKLVQSKTAEYLAPLWNSQKFAQDMYQLFEKLL